MVDKQFKAETDNLFIGLILCRDKNKVVAECSLRDMSKSIGVSEYRLTQEILETFESALSDAEAWEKHISVYLDEENSADDGIIFCRQCLQN